MGGDFDGGVMGSDDHLDVGAIAKILDGLAFYADDETDERVGNFEFVHGKELDVAQLFDRRHRRGDAPRRPTAVGGHLKQPIVGVGYH